MLTNSEYQSRVSAIVRIGGRSRLNQRTAIKTTKRVNPTREKTKAIFRNNMECFGIRTITMHSVQSAIVVMDI